MTFWGFGMNFMLRMNFNIAIVSMVRNSAKTSNDRWKTELYENYTLPNASLSSIGNTHANVRSTPYRLGKCRIECVGIDVHELDSSGLTNERIKLGLVGRVLLPLISLSVFISLSLENNANRSRRHRSSPTLYVNWQYLFRIENIASKRHGGNTINVIIVFAMRFQYHDEIIQ